MDQNETETSSSYTAKQFVGDMVVGAAITYSAYKLARLAYDGAKEGVRFLKDRKKNQTEN